MPQPSPHIAATAAQFPELLPLGIYTLLAVVIVTAMLLSSWWFGARKPGKNKEIAYESGLIPTGNAQFAHPVPFYLVAIFFIVFDVEAVFIFTWAVAWDELGLPGLIHITAFITISWLAWPGSGSRGGSTGGRHGSGESLNSFHAKE
jgi:NADH-quinone oxidoreductase subunit A